MGIVYNSKVGKGYIETRPWTKVISRPRTVQALTASNRLFLLSQGLRIKK